MINSSIFYILGYFGLSIKDQIQIINIYNLIKLMRKAIQFRHKEK